MDQPTGPKHARSTVLYVEDEAVIVAFRKRTLLPLDDCLYALQATIPRLTGSSLHRCLQRHGIAQLPKVEGDKQGKKRFKSYPIGYFDIDIVEVQTAQGASAGRIIPLVPVENFPRWSGGLSLKTPASGRRC